jgi:hypothetical protein
VVRTAIIEQADISDHKAKQAIQVAQHAPELLDGVMSGKAKLRDAAKKAQAKSPLRTRSRRRPAWDMEKRCGRVIQLVRQLVGQCPIERRREFCRWNGRQCEGMV